MPRRQDLSKILVIGSGPIVIGQACEFDYSGTQAIKALKEEGYEVVLINSNPATIMTDPELADRVYIEPLTPEFVEKILEAERPDAILPTMGGQTALNLTMDLHRQGVLNKYNVEILGAKPEVIHRAEDRETFKKTMDSIGVDSARSKVVRTKEDIEDVLKTFGLPLILRPSFTLGGEGGGIAYTREDFLQKIERALFLSPTHDCLVEESLLGWKEFELEVVRDKADNVIIVCSIENFDPMGVHTGDSITVAPAQTLTDREYQNLRDQAIRIIRAIGVETGGSNIQFAIHPTNGRIIVIEMNPRVSRSSALASKATGFPIARIATKLAVGYTLNELQNEITKTTPSSFEPTLDYVVTKIPRFDFEKFAPTPATLTTQMKSVGEVMAMGRTFEESFFKALSGLETSVNYLKPLTGPQLIELAKKIGSKYGTEKEALESLLKYASPYRVQALGQAMREGMKLEEISTLSGIQLWFLKRLYQAVALEPSIAKDKLENPDLLRRAKTLGLSDLAIASLTQTTPDQVAEARKKHGIRGTFLRVDTCAAEFEAHTPYLYSSYKATKDESYPTQNQKVMILGGGPNRIGQGIEFDYCCVHASMQLREMGYETLMVNSNPETVSTDYDISDRLYFEPLTPEHVLNIIDRENPIGVIVQFGGQTPLRLAKELERKGVRILGTSPESIDIAEDRKRCEALIRELKPFGLEQPEATTATSREEAIEKARILGYPVLLRPSYVLGGKGMHIIHDESKMQKFIDTALEMSESHPVLIDRFLDRATEVDVDCVSDGQEVLIGGILEHIEEAGIHSGDSSCSMPVFTLSEGICDRLRTYTREIAKRLKVVGLMNVQYAIQGDRVLVLEINPRASRTVPFVSKAVGVPLAKVATQLMMGRTLKELGFTSDFDSNLTHYHIKSPVFPFHKFPGADIYLGPEMRSTGEVMGRDSSFAEAFAKAMLGSQLMLPQGGHAFMSVRNADKAEAAALARGLLDLGFKISATAGTAQFLKLNRIPVKEVAKIGQGSPNCVDLIQDGVFSFIINTVAEDTVAKTDSFAIRRAALERKVPCSTVLSSARAMLKAIEAYKSEDLIVETIQSRGNSI